MRNAKRQTHLEWRDPEDMRWEDLPTDLRDRAHELLGQLLRHVAGERRPPQEVADDA